MWIKYWYVLFDTGYIVVEEKKQAVFQRTCNIQWPSQLYLYQFALLDLAIIAICLTSGKSSLHPQKCVWSLIEQLTQTGKWSLSHSIKIATKRSVTEHNHLIRKENEKGKGWCCRKERNKHFLRLKTHSKKDTSRWEWWRYIQTPPYHWQRLL